jgi:hypothetical protein
MRIARLPVVASSTLLIVAACSRASDSPAPPPAKVAEPNATAAVATYAPTVVHRDATLGVPTFTWLRSTTSARFATSATADEIAWAAVRRAGPALGLGREALARASTKEVDQHGTGVVVARLAQAVDGVDVFHTSLNVALARNLEPVAITGFLAPVVTPRDKHADFRLSAAAAAIAATHAYTGLSVAESAFAQTGTDGAGYSLLAGTSAKARVKRVWFPRQKGLDAAYHVELDVPHPSRADSDLWSFVVDANDGSILARENLVHADSYSYRVFADASGKVQPFDSPLGNGAIPHPAGIPNRLELPFVPSNLVTLAASPFSRNDPWLPPNATGTTGNNVDAYADLVAPDGFSAGDLRPAPTGTAFDFSYDMSTSSNASDGQRAATAVQMFYLVNFLHDWFYDSGYDEPAGNYQTDNLGRGGVGGDALHAEVEDYSGVNNANASSPADGAPGRIQMYLWYGNDTFFAQVTAPSGIGDLGEVSPSYLDGNGSDRDYDMTTTAVLVADACQAVDSSVSGNIVVVDVAACSIKAQLLNVQNAGAAAMLVVGADPLAAPGILDDATIATPITIPAMGLNKQRGNALETALGAGTVTLRMKRQYRGPDRDSALDTAVAAHEWGHTLSARLIGGGSGLADLPQTQAISEGLSDVVGLLATVRAEDADVGSNAGWNGTFAGGAYVNGGGQTNGVYFGVRRYPYSTDLLKNPLTFKHIADAAVLPTNVPVRENGVAMSEAHNGGEVVASMLWECYAALLRDTPRLSFDEAQSRMKKYFVAALKLTPSSPTLIELRDAFLVVTAASDRDDEALFAAAFAKRGAGLGAVAPDRASVGNVGVVESFVGTGALVTEVSTSLVDDVTSCDHDGILDDGETGKLVVTLKNTGFSDLVGATATVSSGTAALTVGAGGLIAIPKLHPYETFSGSVDVTMTAPTDITPYTLAVAFAGPAQNLPLTVTQQGIGNYDGKASSSKTDHVDAKPSAWTMAGTPASASWQQRGDSIDALWSVVDSSSVSDVQLVSPALQVSPTDDFTLAFRSRWQFEADTDGLWDGGVLELSDDDGATWTDVGATLSPAYGGTLGDGVNPLTGRPAFAGASAGYPAFVTVTASFGKVYAGKTVKLRFRAGSDANTGAAGWEIDDLAFTGITNTPFTSRVPDTTICGAPAPGKEASVDPPGSSADDAGAEAEDAGADDGGCTSTRPARGGNLLPGLGLALALVALRRSRSSRRSSR